MLLPFFILKHVSRFSICRPAQTLAPGHFYPVTITESRTRQSPSMHYKNTLKRTKMLQKAINFHYRQFGCHKNAWTPGLLVLARGYPWLPGNDTTPCSYYFTLLELLAPYVLAVCRKQFLRVNCLFYSWTNSRHCFEGWLPLTFLTIVVWHSLPKLMISDISNLSDPLQSAKYVFKRANVFRTYGTSVPRALKMCFHISQITERCSWFFVVAEATWGRKALRKWASSKHSQNGAYVKRSCPFLWK